MKQEESTLIGAALLGILASVIVFLVAPGVQPLGFPAWGWIYLGTFLGWIFGQQIYPLLNPMPGRVPFVLRATAFILGRLALMLVFSACYVPLLETALDWLLLPIFGYGVALDGYWVVGTYLGYRRRGLSRTWRRLNNLFLVISIVLALPALICGVLLSSRIIGSW